MPINGLKNSGGPMSPEYYCDKKTTVPVASEYAIVAMMPINSIADEIRSNRCFFAMVFPRK